MDINERKQAEADLRESEQRWAVTLASIGDAVIATDTGGRVTFMNKMAEELTGWRMDQAAGEPAQQVFRIVNAHTGETVDDPVNEVLRSGTVSGLAGHTVLLRKEGGQVPIDDSGAPIRDGEGRIQGVVLVFRDITERQSAEQALRESEMQVRRKLESVLSPEGDLGVLELADLIDTASLQSLMDNFYAVARIPMSIIDLTGRVLVGVGWQEICTRFHRVHPDTCRNCLESDLDLSTGLAQGEYRLYQCRNHMWDVVTPLFVAGRHVGNIFTGQFFFEGEVVDRSLFRAQASAYGFDEQEYLAALDRAPRLSRETVQRAMSFFLKLADMISQLGYSNVKLARLLTERNRLTESLQENRAKLERISRQRQLALDAARLGWWHYDPVARKYAWDDRCKEILGIAGYSSPNEELLGRLHPEDLPSVTSRLQAALDPFNPQPYSAEHRINLPDGAIKWIEAHGIASFAEIDGSRQATSFVGTVADITERKRMEQALRQLNENLEQRVSERTELAETRSKQLQALSVELIEAEERERRRIANLLHDDLQQLLASAKMQLQMASANLPGHPMLVNVGQILEEAIAKSRSLSHELSPPVLHHSSLSAALHWLIRRMGEQFGLQVELATHTPQQVRNAPLKRYLYRAVQELLFNIVKHSGVKRAHVAITGVNGSLTLTVSDQGSGFDPDALDESSQKVGFGLLTIRERARYIGGHLSIESSPGQGSRFTLTVPLGHADAGEEPFPSSAADHRISASAMDKHQVGAGGIRILFADDHKVMRQGLILLISGQPHIQVVGEASNGQEALEQVRLLRPDVVLMDISMPEMDGIEATRRIKSELPQVRVIGLSMHEEDQIVKTMREAGADAFVSKTASPAELLKAIYAGL